MSGLSVKMSNILKKHGRLAAFLLLMLVTFVGFRTLMGGNWQEAMVQWRGRSSVFVFAVVLRLIDLSMDFGLWIWVMRTFRIKLGWRRGFLVYLSAGAGILLPAQLGRFIRSDALARMGVASLADAAKAEVLFLFLSMVGAIALLCGSMAYTIMPLSSVPTTILTVCAVCFLVKPISWVLRYIGIEFPVDFLRWDRAVAIGLIAAFGWFLNGIMLYLLLRGLPGDVQLWQATFIVPSNMLAGVLTGLPGGIGAVEGLMGISLGFLQVPSSHLTLAVGAFRLLTFWMWLPAGWVAFLWVNRIIPKHIVTDPVEGPSHAK